MRNVLILLGLLSVVAVCGQADPLGTAITYQGYLEASGSPATGLFDVQFSLFDAAVGGAPAGPPITVTNVSVAGGNFSTRIDFGPGVFAGDSLWLELAVRAAGGGSFVTLTPRHEVTPAPYALRTVSAEIADFATAAGDADTVDGEHADAFANFQHGHPGSDIDPGSIAGTQLARESVWPEHAGRSNTVRSYFYQVPGPGAPLDIPMPPDKIFIVTDVECCTSASRQCSLYYDAGSGFIQVYYHYSPAGSLCSNESFRSGIPIPAGATLRLQGVSSEGLTVAGFEIAAN